MGRISRRRVTIVVGVAVLFVAAALAIRLQVAVPTDSAAVPVARAVLAGPVGSPPIGPVFPGLGLDAGGACLPRIAHDAGWLDLCWAGSFYGRQSDGKRDYYLLRLYGSHQGMRWVSLRAQVAGSPADALFDMWPDGIYVGECHQEPVIVLVPMTTGAVEDVCGRTEGQDDATSRSGRLTWTCEMCLVPDGSTRAVSMYAVVGVPAGTVPSWDLFASGGS